jgi:hypothetical protein
MGISRHQSTAAHYICTFVLSCLPERRVAGIDYLFFNCLYLACITNRVVVRLTVVRNTKAAFRISDPLSCFRRVLLVRVNARLY